MASIKQLQDGLLHDLAPPLATHGFMHRLRSQSYYKDNHSGKSAFHVSFIKHRGDVDLTADVAIRIEALEELVNADDAGISAKDSKATFSIGAELGNLSDGKPQRWTLVTPDDVPSVVPSIVAAFESIGLPFLSRYADPKAALELLVRNDTQSRRVSPIAVLRWKQIVGLALLLGDSRLDHLIDSGTKYLQERRDPQLEGFLAFVKGVRHRAQLSS
jgi:hypothetical protein